MVTVPSLRAGHPPGLPGKASGREGGRNPEATSVSQALDPRGGWPLTAPPRGLLVQCASIGFIDAGLLSHWSAGISGVWGTARH